MFGFVNYILEDRNKRISVLLSSLTVFSLYLLN